MKASARHLPLALLCAALAAAPIFAADLPLPAPPEPRLPELSSPNLSTPQRLESASEVIPADVAFHVVAFPDPDGSVVLTWQFPPRIYLYRKSLVAEKALDGTPLALELPEGQVISDEFFGESEVYFERLIARIPASQLNAAPGSELELNLTYQGCLQDIYCYPPIMKTVSVTLP